MEKKREKIFSSRDRVVLEPCTTHTAPAIIPELTCEEAMELAEQKRTTGDLAFGHVFTVAAHCVQPGIEHHAQCPRKDSALFESLRAEIRAVFADE